MLRVTILGTSSAVPTLKRSLSGTLFEREGEAFLFDCGEGTQFQFMRAAARRGRLTSIFITHLHGDHFYGLPGFLSSLNLNQRTQPLAIYGPTGIRRYFEFMTSFPRPQRYGFEVSVHELEPDFEGVVSETDEWAVYSLPLDHRVPTHGYRVEEKPRPGVFDAAIADQLGVPFGPERRKLQMGQDVVLENGRIVRSADIVGPPRPGAAFAYCTDTFFSINAKRLAQDVDILLHECTYADELLETAIERKHSTIRQAAAVARGARAKRFIATHFSARYDRELLEMMEREGREIYPDLIMARDLMSIEI